MSSCFLLGSKDSCSIGFCFNSSILVITILSCLVGSSLTSSLLFVVSTSSLLTSFFSFFLCLNIPNILLNIFDKLTLNVKTAAKIPIITNITIEPVLPNKLYKSVINVAPIKPPPITTEVVPLVSKALFAVILEILSIKLSYVALNISPGLSAKFKNSK